jgi:hypothetical protein
VHKKLPTYPRILGIAPSPAGVGLGVIEGLNSLIGWDMKRVRESLNSECMVKVEKAIDYYQPQVIVMEDSSERSSRHRALIKRIVALAGKRGVGVVMLSRKQVRGVFFVEGLGSKDALAEILAQRFPEELGARLPRKRRTSMSEDHRMAMFEAVALALAFRPYRRLTGL